MILDVKKNDDGEYTIQIDNKYNSSTWTHPEISITLEIEIDGNVTKFNEKNGNFNLGKNWKNGTYNATHFYFSSNPKLIANKTNKGTRIKDTFTLSEADTSAGTIEGEERFGSSIPNSFNLSLEGDFADAFSLTAKSYANELRANNNQKLISELTFLRHRQNWLIVTQEIGRRFGSKSLEAPEIKKLSGFIDASIKALAGLKTRNISFFVKTDTEKIALDTATLILAYNVSFEPKKENPISAVAKDLDPPKETVLEITKEEEDKEAALAKETIRITRMINENEKAITNLLTLLQDKSTRDEHLPSKANIVSSQLNLLIKKFNELNTEFQTEAKLIDSENEFAAPKQLMVNIERLKVKFISDKKIFKNTRIIPDLWSEKFKEDIDYIDLNKLIKKAIKEFENYETTIKKISGVSNEKDIDDINEKLKRVVILFL